MQAKSFDAFVCCVAMHLLYILILVYVCIYVYTLVVILGEILCLGVGYNLGTARLEVLWCDHKKYLVLYV